MPKDTRVSDTGESERRLGKLHEKHIVCVKVDRVRGRPSGFVDTANGPPNPVVTILAGSRIAGLDDTEVSQPNLPGVSYDLYDRVHVFSESVDVALSGNVIPKLLGCSVSGGSPRQEFVAHGLGITLISLTKPPAFLASNSAEHLVNVQRRSAR